MDPVNNLSQIVETLRRQLYANSKKLDAKSARASVPMSADAASARPEIHDLKRKIRERLRGIDPKNDVQRNKAVKIFLESVVRWEFGDAMIDDPRFYEMIAEVQLTMESNRETNEELTTLISDLTATKL